MKYNQNFNNFKRVSLKSLKHSFTGKNISPFGGMAIVKSIIDKIHLKKEINSKFSAFNFRKELNIGALFEQIITTMIVGGTCIQDTKMLKDQYLMKLFGWKRIPDDGTYSRRFSEFRSADIEKFRLLIREKAMKELTSKNLFITIDPTVQTVYGNQEKAAVGYNPNKQGRKSYFPFIAYEFSKGRIIDAMMRPGNTSSSTDIIEFVRPLLKLRGRKGMTIRLDKGCAISELCDYIHEEAQYYVGKAKMFPVIWDNIEALKSCQWKSIGSDIQIGEFFYKNKRHIVVEQMCTKSGDQLNLWGKNEAKVSVIVTNRPDKAESIWRMYNKGAMVETAIKEIKNDMSALSFRTQSFNANEVFLLLGVLGWDITRNIREVKSLGDFQYCAMKKLRWLILKVPAIISTVSRYLKVKLNQDAPFQKVFWNVFRAFIPI